MNLNRQKFLQGVVLVLSILSISWFVWRPIEAVTYPWNCSQTSNGFNFTNTEGAPREIACVEYINCDCPGDPLMPEVGQCGQNENWIWQKTVAADESGFCTFSQSIADLARCKIHQVDLKVYNPDGQTWSDRPFCWFISNKCEECGEPSPTPTEPVSTLTPTPTKPVSSPTPTPTPPSETACWAECTDGTDCQGDNVCQEVSGTKRCVNPDCETESDCTCNKHCWDVCGHDNECPAGLSCRQIDNTKRCVKSECEREQDCDCAVPTPPSVLGEKAPPVLPAAGFGWDKYAFVCSLVLFLRFLIAAL